MLTVGVGHGRSRIGVDDLTVFTFPRDAEDVLLHTMLSEFTLFRPATHAGALTMTLYREQFLLARPQADHPRGTMSEIAVALRRDPADRRSLTQWAMHLHTTPATLGREILTQSGQTFPQWRANSNGCRTRTAASRRTASTGVPPPRLRQPRSVLACFQ